MIHVERAAYRFFTRRGIMDKLGSQFGDSCSTFFVFTSFGLLVTTQETLGKTG
ncbi:hypothetical protein CPB83DRAFT_846361 [Crepidotus variabilis]|uniref:Uncharacterized protein n=1 Tax=Crepidotus variabilis TaxID=179855 RepID=A0A9P6EPN0_9AGAR|nr:hypothetical protein CPB83DRAFT_846361 [Crepidotus variabilis]